MQTSSHRLKAIYPLFLTVFLDSIGMGIIFPLLVPLFFSNDSLLFDHEASSLLKQTFYGITLAVFPIGMFFATPILGDLSDKLGRKVVLLFCLTGVAISYFLSALAVYAGWLGLLILSRLIAGISAGSVSTAQAAVVDLCPANEKARYLSLLLFPVSLGFVAGPLFAVFFGNPHWSHWLQNWTPLVIAGVLAVLNLILLVYTFQETRFGDKNYRLAWNKAVLLFQEAFRRKNLRHIALVFLLFEISWSLYFQYISVFMFKRFHYTNQQIGFFMSFIALGFSVAFLYLIPQLTRRYSSQHLLITTLILGGFFMLINASLYDLGWVWLAAFGVSVTNAIAYTALLTLCSNMVSEAQQGWIMGITAAISSAAFAITGLSSFLIELMGSATAALYGGACISIVAVLIFFLSQKSNNSA